MNGISIVCDTNPLIYLLDGNRNVARFLDSKQIYVSVITELELFGKQNLSVADNEIIESLLENCFIIDINQEIKHLYRKIKREYAIKLPDAIIASTAIYLDLPLLTFDRDFEYIPNLKLVTWK
ncbi:MAG: type II toxin-antitoxin system VapC family toxin [Lentimicrobiaceae bacterium]|nr:type II toxin-antitoxin system VapC family toxin [Lentimicrobiaceae bacterium]